MLAGLGKELRRCGVDTVILDNDKDHVEVAKVIRNFFLNIRMKSKNLFINQLKIARQEDRYALSVGLPFFSVNFYL